MNLIWIVFRGHKTTNSFGSPYFEKHRVLVLRSLVLANSIVALLIGNLDILEQRGNPRSYKRGI